jgi:hypothetical protein
MPQKSVQIISRHAEAEHHGVLGQLLALGHESGWLLISPLLFSYIKMHNSFM